MRQLLLAIVLLTLAVGVAGCRGAKPEAPKMAPPRVTVIRPVEVLVRDYWLYNGYLESTKEVEVRSKIRGFLASVEFPEGAEVEAGKPLYKIDRLEYETALNKAKAEVDKAEAEIRNWEAQIKLAETDRDRFAEAVKKGVEARPELDKAQSTYDVRVAERNAAIATHKAALATRKTAEIQLGYTDIKAKIGGRISRTHVDEGNLIQADTTLMTTILKVDELYVNFDAPEGDFVAFQKLMDAQKSASSSLGIPVEVGVTGEDGYKHIGRIDFRENRIESATGTIRIRGRIDNPMENGIRAMIPGMYARVRVPKGNPVPQLVVPEDCLLSGQEGRFLYVVGADGKVEKRIVTVGAVVWKAPTATPGASSPGWVALKPQQPNEGEPQKPVAGKPPPSSRLPIKSIVAITAGLKDGDRVILEGLQKVKPGDQVEAEEWNMTPPKDQSK